jgi:CIC family chloride channel protein
MSSSSDKNGKPETGTHTPSWEVRRGYPPSREYAVEPLEILYVGEVMRTQVLALSAASTLGEMPRLLRSDHPQEQRLLPVVDAQTHLAGALTRQDMRERLERDGDAALQIPLRDLGRRETVEAAPAEPRAAVYRMAEKGFTRMPAVDRETQKFLGLISLDDLLKGRARHLEEERRGDRPLRLRFLSGGCEGDERVEEPIAR